MKTNAETKVIVALSGGVDSAVAAALLVEQGYKVEGVFMKNWSGDEFAINSDCPWEQDQKDAEAVSRLLKIPFRSVNFEKEYRDKVVSYFFDEYKQGRTPNPDVMCNKEIKFNLFLEKAHELGANFIATGHYARIAKQDKEFLLLKGIDNNKDQSYFLHRLNQKQLSKSLFPVGKLTKAQVRELARKLKLPVAKKKDSQGICFIGKIDVQKFLRSNIEKRKGDIVDIDTHEVIGSHEGVMFYTIGQREGIGIGGVGKPYYVVSKDSQENILYVGQGRDNPALYQSTVDFEDLHFISDHQYISGQELIANHQQKKNSLSASLRYRHQPEAGTLNLADNKFIFEQPQRAPTPGQSIVFYNQDVCLGGGIISSAAS